MWRSYPRTTIESTIAGMGWLRRAELAPEEKARRALLNAYGIWREVTDERYPDRNTYSDGL